MIFNELLNVMGTKEMLLLFRGIKEVMRASDQRLCLQASKMPHFTIKLWMNLQRGLVAQVCSIISPVIE